jgi:hypothetical protein
MRTPIALPFSKLGMTARDLMNAAGDLQGILRDFDNFSDDPEEFVLRVKQIRKNYNPNA